MSPQKEIKTPFWLDCWEPAGTGCAEPLASASIAHTHVHYSFHLPAHTALSSYPSPKPVYSVLPRKSSLFLLINQNPLSWASRSNNPWPSPRGPLLKAWLSHLPLCLIHLAQCQVVSLMCQMNEIILLLLSDQSRVIGKFSWTNMVN